MIVVNSLKQKLPVNKTTFLKHGKTYTIIKKETSLFPDSYDITLKPPLLLKNCLPVPLSVEFEDSNGYFKDSKNKLGHHHRRNSSKSDSPFIGGRQRCSSTCYVERTNVDMYYESGFPSSQRRQNDQDIIMRGIATPRIEDTIDCNDLSIV